MSVVERRRANKNENRENGERVEDWRGTTVEIERALNVSAGACWPAGLSVCHRQASVS